jgi:hypothetical protein
MTEVRTVKVEQEAMPVLGERLKAPLDMIVLATGVRLKHQKISFDVYLDLDRKCCVCKVYGSAELVNCKIVKPNN